MNTILQNVARARLEDNLPLTHAERRAYAAAIIKSKVGNEMKIDQALDIAIDTMTRIAARHPELVAWELSDLDEAIVLLERAEKNLELIDSNQRELIEHWLEV